MKKKFVLLMCTLVVLSLVTVSCIKDRVKPYSILNRHKGMIRVQFNFHSPSARDVYIAGDFNGWVVPKYKDESFSHTIRRSYRMKRIRDYWTVIVPMSPGIHYYKYYIDLLYWKIDEVSHHKTQTLSGEWRNIVIVK